MKIIDILEVHANKGGIIPSGKKCQDQPRQLEVSVAEWFACLSKLGVGLYLMLGIHCHFQLFLFRLCFFSLVFPGILTTIPFLVAQRKTAPTPSPRSLSQLSSSLNGNFKRSHITRRLETTVFEALASSIDEWNLKKYEEDRPCRRERERGRARERNGKIHFFNFSIVVRYRSASRRLATVSATAGTLTQGHLS